MNFIIPLKSINIMIAFGNKAPLKKLRHGWRILKKKGPIFFKFAVAQSVFIFSILNHPCPCLVYDHLFGVLLLEAFFNLKVILHLQK